MTRFHVFPVARLAFIELFQSSLDALPLRFLTLRVGSFPGQQRGHLFLPETEVAMSFERGHGAENFFEIEEHRPTPLDGFYGLGAGSVDELTETLQDRLGEGWGVFDVLVYARVGNQHFLIVRATPYRVKKLVF